VSLRIGNTRLRNTELDLLKCAVYQPGITIKAIVSLWWPRSNQPEKKSATLAGYYNRLERMGYVRKIGSGYHPTPFGRKQIVPTTPEKQREE